MRKRGDRGGRRGGEGRERKVGGLRRGAGEGRGRGKRKERGRQRLLSFCSQFPAIIRPLFMATVITSSLIIAYTLFSQTETEESTSSEMQSAITPMHKKDMETYQQITAQEKLNGNIPLRDIIYSTNGSSSDRATFVVPRRVYYDNRLVFGKRRNSVIILAEERWHNESNVNKILACELNGHISKSIKVLYTRPQDPHYANLHLVIQCIGLPQNAIFNGSTARVIYKKKDESFYSRVVSEKPLFLHEGSHNPSTPTKGQGSIVVCTTMYGHPDKFDQWLMYQKYLGVERVYVNAHPSFSEGALDIYPFFKDSLKNGFAHMDIWNQYGNKTNTYNQMMKYQDCLYRHIGVFEYGFFYDYDDFFNPVLADHKDAHYYLSKFFSDDKVGTVCMQWRQMRCGPIEKLVKDLPHGNLTSILSSTRSNVRRRKKCAHRLSAPKMVSVHRIESFLGKYRSVDCPKELAYVAHNRHTNKQCT